MRPGFWVDLIMTSDWHMSHRPPIARSHPDQHWYSVMFEYIQQIKNLSTLLQAPIVVAGDVLNHWTEPAELVNFLIEHMPHVYGIPGQHDLPNHNYADIKRSPYWTLVQAGKISHIDPDKPRCISTRKKHRGLVLHGFPWNRPLLPLALSDDRAHVAIAHKYIWMGEHKHEGADAQTKASKLFGILKGYTAAAFGDNHKGFIIESSSCPIINCGTLIRRFTDEVGYHPGVGLLWNDGKITRYHLRLGIDKFLLDESNKIAGCEGLGVAEQIRLGRFLRSASELSSSSGDWSHVVNWWLKSSNQDSEILEIVRRLAGV
jgi:DNA repair exonuclease SbcCD nuclease subunit